MKATNPSNQKLKQLTEDTIVAFSYWSGGFVFDELENCLTSTVQWPDAGPENWYHSLEILDRVFRALYNVSYDVAEGNNSPSHTGNKAGSEFGTSDNLNSNLPFEFTGKDSEENVFSQKKSHNESREFMEWINEDSDSQERKPEIPVSETNRGGQSSEFLDDSEESTDSAETFKDYFLTESVKNRNDETRKYEAAPMQEFETEEDLEESFQHTQPDFSDHHSGNGNGSIKNIGPDHSIKGFNDFLKIVGSKEINTSRTPETRNQFPVSENDDFITGAQIRLKKNKSGSDPTQGLKTNGLSTIESPVLKHMDDSISLFRNDELFEEFSKSIQRSFHKYYGKH